MNDAWKFDFNHGLLWHLKSVRVCLMHRFWQTCNADILVNIYFTYISRDYIGLFQQFILLVYLLWCLLPCISGTVLNYRAVIKKNLYINVLFCTPGKTFSSKNGKKIKKRENNKTRAMLHSGLFSHINVVNPRLAIEVESEFPDMNYKGQPQNSLKASVPNFQPGISAWTMGLSPSHKYVTELKNLRWYNVELLLQKQVVGCKHV